MNHVRVDNQQFVYNHVYDTRYKRYTHNDSLDTSTTVHNVMYQSSVVKTQVCVVHISPACSSGVDMYKQYSIMFASTKHHDRYDKLRISENQSAEQSIGPTCRLSNIVLSQ